MAFADTALAQLRYIPEVTWGTTPATPALQNLRFTSESLNANVTTIVSEEIRSDRQIPDLIQTGSDASGDIGIELSFGTYDDFFEGVMLSDYSTQADNDGTFNSDFAASTLTGTGIGTNIVAGQWIRASGFSTAVDGFYRVTTASANSLTVTPPPGASAGDDVTGSGDENVTGQMLRNGTTRKFYTIQKQFEGTGSQYFNFRGSYIAGMSLNFARQAIATGSFTIMAKSGERVGSQIAGASIVPATTTDVLNGVANVQDIREGTYATDTTLSITELSIELTNNLRGQDAIGSLPHVGIGLGRIGITGTFNSYFEDGSLYDKFIANSATSLTFRVTDLAGNSYIFTLPKIKIASGNVVAGGIDQDIMASFEYQAILDPTTNCTFQIDKLSAA